MSMGKHNVSSVGGGSTISTHKVRNIKSVNVRINQQNKIFKGNSNTYIV